MGSRVATACILTRETLRERVGRSRGAAYRLCCRPKLMLNADEMSSSRRRGDLTENNQELSPSLEPKRDGPVSPAPRHQRANSRSRPRARARAALERESSREESFPWAAASMKLGRFPFSEFHKCDWKQPEPLRRPLFWEFILPSHRRTPVGFSSRPPIHFQAFAVSEADEKRNPFELLHFCRRADSPRDPLSRTRRPTPGDGLGEVARGQRSSTLDAM